MTNDAVLFEDSDGHEYHLLVHDFEAFYRDYSVCAAQLEKLCALEDSQVKIFVWGKGWRKALGLAVKYEDNGAQAIKCDEAVSSPEIPLLYRAQPFFGETTTMVNEQGYRASAGGFVLSEEAVAAHEEVRLAAIRYLESLPGVLPG